MLKPIHVLGKPDLAYASRMTVLTPDRADYVPGRPIVFEKFRRYVIVSKGPLIDGKVNLELKIDDNKRKVRRAMKRMQP